MNKVLTRLFCIQIYNEGSYTTTDEVHKLSKVKHKGRRGKKIRKLLQTELLFQQGIIQRVHGVQTAPSDRAKNILRSEMPLLRSDYLFHGRLKNTRRVRERGKKWIQKKLRAGGVRVE